LLAPFGTREHKCPTYIKNRYGGKIDGLIVDELHQYANDSGQGDAMEFSLTPFCDPIYRTSELTTESVAEGIILARV
jgi:hypothetical protein